MSHVRVVATLLVCFVPLCITTGCGGAEAKVYSGFLSSYDGLREDAIRPNARSYFNPHEGLRDYDAFLIEPVVIHFGPAAKGTTIHSPYLQQLATFFHGQLIQALTENYQVVREPGVGVLRLRVAITDVQEGNTALNIVPVSKLMGLGLGGASMESEALDAMTGQRIAAYMETAKGSQFSLEGLDSMDNARQVIRVWVKDFVARVDKAHGR